MPVCHALLVHVCISAHIERLKHLHACVCRTNIYPLGTVHGMYSVLGCEAGSFWNEAVMYVNSQHKSMEETIHGTTALKKRIRKIQKYILKMCFSGGLLFDGICMLGQLDPVLPSILGKCSSIDKNTVPWPKQNWTENCYVLRTRTETKAWLSFKEDTNLAPMSVCWRPHIVLGCKGYDKQSNWQEGETLLLHNFSSNNFHFTVWTENVYNLLIPLKNDQWICEFTFRDCSTCF